MGGLWVEWADPVTVPYCAGSILPTLYLEAPKNKNINRQTKQITAISIPKCRPVLLVLTKINTAVNLHLFFCVCV